ncbi:hypothetical protein [Companilactobacillus ginsenosidimutans]|uniref:Uncharacterized protein n=1 Tax=Companilactobacillus ginsenosidimutans TaxID=1007676 RepID=A0A0H4QK66_9LACO|nr:hypothetical protein [Companilactobacillus ginsenosidimutans]AKP67426.1 hypothetical protein ABM34_07690 [Companilactobacillus ginsenosidimutans]
MENEEFEKKLGDIVNNQKLNANLDSIIDAATNEVQQKFIDTNFLSEVSNRQLDENGNLTPQNAMIAAVAYSTIYTNEVVKNVIKKIITESK